MSTDASAGTDTSALAEALLVLRAHLEQVVLPLDVAGADPARRTRREVLDQLDDQLLPRLRAAGAPLLVVLGGSTGAGKSTLANSLLGRLVSESGVLRPTTRWPVLVHHPGDVGWFATDRVLPGLARVRADGTPAATATARAGATGPVGGAGAGVSGVRLVPSDALWPGLAVLDAPDIDSVVEQNRTLAVQLLGAADLWLFVTTAARYADAVPWDLLQQAARRSVALAVVLDRVDVGTEVPVTTDLRRMLDEHGLADVPVLLVPEAPPVDGLLPEAAIADVADWLTALGEDAAARAAAITRTRDGLVDDVVRRAELVADAADAQREARDRLRAQVDEAFAAAVDDIGRATSDGSLLRGEVLARWQELVGTGELLRSLERGVSRLRDRLVAAFRGRPAAAPELQEAIGHDLDVLVSDAVATASERVSAGWRSDPAGGALLPAVPVGDQARLRADVAAQVRGWQDDVLALVTEEGSGRRTTARALSFGVNGIGAALMLTVFASTGGLTGAEIGIAGGAAVLAQRVLEAVFGDDAVRRLTRSAQERLTARIRSVADAEAARFTVALDALGLGPGDARGVRAAAVRVAAAPRPSLPGGQPTGGHSVPDGADAAERAATGAGHGGDRTSAAGGATGGPQLGGRLRGAGMSDARQGDESSTTPAGHEDVGAVRRWWHRVVGRDTAR